MVESARAPRVVDHLARALEAAGVELVFGVPGGAIASLYDALLDRKIQIVNFRHETTAVFAAAGAALQGKLVCVLVTSGPGITNALTGIASAFADNLPVLIIAGEVPAKNAGRGALQDGSTHTLDVLSMVRPVTKMATTLLHPGSAEAVLRRALGTASSGRRGPVFLALPADVGAARVQASAFAPAPRLSFDLDDEVFTEAAHVLLLAERPLVLAGSGARHKRARAGIVALAEALECPVATTPKAKGVFPEDHRLAVGILGYGGHRSAQRLLEEDPDVILVVGSSLGETSTLGWSLGLKPSHSLLQIDVDASVVGRNYQTELALVGGAEDVVPRLVARIEHGQGGTRRAQRTLGLSRHEALVDVADGSAGPRTLHPAAALLALQRKFGDGIYTSDIGEHLMFALHVLQIGAGSDFHGHLGLGSMGSGLGSAIGAKLARPDRTVVSVCGDWGFQMFGLELATCVDERAGVVFAVMNDGAMRMVEAGFHRIFGRSPRVAGPLVDFAALAQAVGARGFVIQSVADIERLDATLGQDGVPVLLDVRIDPHSAFPVAARTDQVGTFARSEPPT